LLDCGEMEKLKNEYRNMGENKEGLRNGVTKELRN
jgi:hypothetical protein